MKIQTNKHVRRRTLESSLRWKRKTKTNKKTVLNYMNKIMPYHVKIF